MIFGAQPCPGALLTPESYYSAGNFVPIYRTLCTKLKAVHIWPSALTACLIRAVEFGSCYCLVLFYSVRFFIIPMFIPGLNSRIKASRTKVHNAEVQHGDVGLTHSPFSDFDGVVHGYIALNPLKAIALMLKLTLASSVAMGLTLLITRPVQAQAQLRGDIIVEINGLDAQSGNVCLSIFNSSQGFPSDWQQAIDAECVAISSTPLQVTFEDLSYGSYAIAAYHDKNRDQQLNQGLFGIPTEGFAFSNDAPAQTGPASFQDAAFFLSQRSATIRIQMRYLGLGGR